MKKLQQTLKIGTSMRQKICLR